MQPTRTQRLMRLIELLNQIHCKRRILGKPTAHLYSRSRAVISAYLDTINQPES
jgi:hypothetical protein